MTRGEMTSIDSGGACLVARAMPSLPKETTNADNLADQLSKLAVAEPTADEPKKKQTTLAAASSRATKFDRISPSDFVALQSIRSSALARKTNTTSKFGRAGSALFGELLSKGDKDTKDSGNESSESLNVRIRSLIVATRKSARVHCSARTIIVRRCLETDPRSNRLTCD